MHGVLDFVDSTLARREGLAHRDSGRHVTAVARRQFGTRVYQEQLAILDAVAVIVVVQGLSVDGGDGGKRQLAVVALGHVVHLGHHLILIHTGTDEAGSGDVHISSNVAGAFYLGDFLGSLMIALFHHGADERHGAFLVGRRQAQPVHQLQFVLGTIGRQVVDGAALLDGVVQIGHQLVGRTCLDNAHGSGLLVQGGLGTHPDDVVDGEFIAEDDFTVLVNVNHGIQPGKVQAEIIKERGVLAVAEGVVLVIQSLFVIAQKKQYS